jgi:hypothetical protein
MTTMLTVRPFLPTVSLVSAPFLTRTTCGILTSRSMDLHSRRTRVCTPWIFSSYPWLACRVFFADQPFFSGGVFKLELFLPDDYPMTPPKIRFLTKLYHPNVDKLGRICLDVLKSRSHPTAFAFLFAQ